jgi:hypothetical protein
MQKYFLQIPSRLRHSEGPAFSERAEESPIEAAPRESPISPLRSKPAEIPRAFHTRAQLV